MLETGKTPYVHGAAAEALEQERVEYNIYEENELLKAKRRQKANNVAKIKIVFAVIIGFTSFFVLIYRYNYITGMNYDLHKMDKQYNEIRNENSRLKVEIEQKLDLQTLKETAEKRLEMQKPDKYQTIRVNVPKTDYTRVADEYKNTKSLDSNVFSQIIDKVSKFTSLLY